MLTEPAAVVYRALVKADLEPGSRVLVIGDGTIALLAVALARLWSPAEIAVLGRRGEQADLARIAGATSFHGSAQAAERGGLTADFDLVVEAAGTTAAAQTALDAGPGAAGPSCCSACRRTARRRAGSRRRGQQ